MASIDNLLHWVRRQMAPLTLSIAAAMVVLSLLFWFTLGKGMGFLGFDAAWLSKPWSLFTYPFAYMGLGGINALISMALLLAWMMFSCASIERQIGTARYAIVWVAMTVIPAMLALGAMAMMGAGIGLLGPFLPIAGVSVVWCTRNKHASMSLFGILPLNGIMMGWIVVAGTFFQFGMGAPLMGALMCVHLGLAYLFGEDKIPFFPYKPLGVGPSKPTKEQIRRESEFRDDVRRREQERGERERLRKLFEGSIKDDPPEK